MKKVLAILAALMTITACWENGPSPEEVLTDSTPQLVIGGKIIIRYDEMNSQLSCNGKRHEFGIHTDSMNDYFRITLSDAPREAESLTGNITWSTETDLVIRKGVSFNVVKEEDGTFWLENRRDGISIVIKELE